MQYDDISEFAMQTAGMLPFLFIEPSERPRECINDELTRKMTALLRGARPVNMWGGHHTCICNAKSGNSDLVIEIHGQQMVTHSLIVHYVACHRHEIPSDALELLATLTDEAEPLPGELAFI